MDVYSAQALPLLLTPRKDGSYVRSRGELALEPDPGLPALWKLGVQPCVVISGECRVGSDIRARCMERLCRMASQHVFL